MISNFPPRSRRSFIQKVIYTTNAIESLSSTYRRLNSQRSVFPSVAPLMKALYLISFEATKKWSIPVRNWRSILGESSVIFEAWMPV
ncbi:transposase [Synergistes jonesii]|uniref:transposase n=1 Tax=Synergistes jonesii TaxID=2754 RepID=UPI00248E0F26|nr:transposase [Synergistes jonesii]